MISHKHKFIFIHIPKTAGTSIDAVLRDESCQLLPDEWDYTRMSHAPLNHLTLQEVADYGILTPAQLKSYFKFCFVRNPWDRLVSEIFCRWMREVFSDLTVDQRIRRACELATIPPGYANHLLPQVNFVTAAGLQMDFIGRFERLEEDFAQICRLLGIEATLPHRNRSQHQPYPEYYDAESQALVANTYRRDIDAFQYTFSAELRSRTVAAEAQPQVVQPVEHSAGKPIITAYPLHAQPVPWQPVAANAAAKLPPVASAAWYLCCPVGFTACWNGGPKVEDIEIHLAAETPTQPVFVQSNLGKGLITFYPGYQCQVMDGQRLWVRGPFHTPKDGLAPLESIIDAALLPSTVTIHWQFTRPHQTVSFAAGEPFAAVLLYPPTALNNLQVEVVQPEADVDAYSAALQQLNDKPEIQHLFQRLSAQPAQSSLPEPARPSG